MRKIVLAVLAVLVIALSGCSHNVYSPPSQAYALAPTTTLAPGHQAMDVEVSQHAQLFDPAVNVGAGRFRTGIGASSELSAEGAAMVVDESGPSDADRNLYSGRVGWRHRPTTGVSLGAGLGGGYAPAGGSFGAIDAGISFAFENCVLVPVAQFSGYLSEPLSPKAVNVTTSSDKMPRFDTPERTIGGVVRGGLRLSLSPSQCRAGEQVPWVTLGLGSTSMMDRDSDAMLMGIGLGVEIPL